MDEPQQIGFTAAESTPRFPLDPKPPAGAPNVVVIVLDDTGFGHLGAFGSDIGTPHMDSLAAGGAPFNRFHVTSLCSPTRASFFTGRNHHAVGMGFLADIPLAFPGYHARLPRTAAALPRLLRDAGYSTLAVGKWHLTPRWQRSAAGPFDSWPLGLGFERHYGFLQGDTNHWAPNLVCDNHYVDPPRRPEEGYHLSEDLADQAVRMVQDQQQAAPGKPFFLYFALGAMHAPHHVTPEWVDPYRGVFDKGWDSWREELFARQVAAGIVPEGTVLTPRPEWVQAWSELSADERRLLSRQQEVFAGFLTHTDAQIGRVLSSLESLGVMDNTLVMVFSDNGASAEGGKIGSANEHRFSAHLRESLADNLAHYDDWGGFTTYNHYSWAWAWAGNTPHKLWKRYTWLGGTRTPLIVHWGGRIARPGAVRSQFAHAVDLMPTIMAAAGLEIPAEVDGVAQQDVDGVSLLGVLEDPDAAELHHTQYFEMMGSRSIYHEGWKATTDHISTGVLDEEELAVGSRNFTEDRWELFDLSVDFSEAIDVSDEHPERVRRHGGPVDRRGGAEQRPARLRRPRRSPRRLHPPGLAGGAVAHLPARWRRGGRRVDPPPVRRLPHDGGDRCRSRRGRRRHLRARRLVRGLRPLRGGRRRPLHVRPGGRCARARRTVRAHGRAPRHRRLLRARGGRGARSYGPARGRPRGRPDHRRGRLAGGAATRRRGAPART